MSRLESSDHAQSQVARVIDQLLIMVAELPAGSRLPSERELAERFSVARMTLRRAMDTLINRGLLERRAGSGTYIAKPLVASELRLASFSEEIRARGLTPRTEVIDFRRKRATRSSALELRIPENEEIYVFTRLRFANDDPVAIETTKIPCQYVPDLSEELLANSLYDLLFTKFNILIISAKTEISAITLDLEQARLLDAPVSQPSLELEMKDFDQSGRLIMAAHCVYRADKYKLAIQANSGVRDKSRLENRIRNA